MTAASNTLLISYLTMSLEAKAEFGRVQQDQLQSQFLVTHLLLSASSAAISMALKF